MILEVFSWFPFATRWPGKKRCLSKNAGFRAPPPTNSIRILEFQEWSWYFHKLPQVICGQTINQQLLWWKVWNKNNKCLYFLYISYILGTIVSAFHKSTHSSPVPLWWRYYHPHFSEGETEAQRVFFFFNRFPTIIHLVGDRDKSWSQAVWLQRSFFTIIS